MALSKLAQSSRAKRGPHCEVCFALTQIPPVEADALVALLSDPRRRYSELSRDLANDPDTPLRIGAHTLSRHARGECDAKTRLR